MSQKNKGGPYYIPLITISQFLIHLIKLNDLLGKLKTQTMKSSRHLHIDWLQANKYYCISKILKKKHKKRASQIKFHVNKQRAQVSGVNRVSKLSGHGSSKKQTVRFLTSAPNLRPPESANNGTIKLLRNTMTIPLGAPRVWPFRDILTILTLMTYF